MDFLNVSTLSAHSARASARGRFWCAPMNFPDKIDEFWLLDHIFSSKTHKVHLGWSPTWFLHRELFFANHRLFLTSSFKLRLVMGKIKGCQLKSYPLFHWENSVYLILRSLKSMIFYHVPKETSNFWYFFQINFVMNHLFPETRSFQSKYFNKM